MKFPFTIIKEIIDSDDGFVRFHFSAYTKGALLFIHSVLLCSANSDKSQAAKYSLAETVEKGKSSRETFPPFVGAGYIRPEVHYVITMFFV